jgi:hypothetical protein
MHGNNVARNGDRHITLGRMVSGTKSAKYVGNFSGSINKGKDLMSRSSAL